MIDAVSVATAGSGEAAAGAGRGKGDMGKEEFLKLLVTQLEQQNPLDPQDGAEFVAQLAQFTSLERLVNIEGALGNVAMASMTTNSMLASGFLGKEVLLEGDDFAHNGGQSTLQYDLDKSATNVSIEVRDASGKLVDTIQGGTDSGRNEVTWNGTVTNEDGETTTLEDGKYSFRVTATDDDGGTIGSTEYITSKVTAVSFRDGVPTMMLSNGDTAGLNEIRQIMDLGTPSPAEPESSDDETSN